MLQLPTVFSLWNLCIWHFQNILLQTSHMLNNHMWLVATISDRTPLEQINLFLSTTYQYPFQVYLTMISILKWYRFLPNISKERYTGFLQKLVETISTKEKASEDKNYSCISLDSALFQVLSLDKTLYLGRLIENTLTLIFITYFNLCLLVFNLSL